MREAVSTHDSRLVLWRRRRCRVRILRAAPLWCWLADSISDDDEDDDLQLLETSLAPPAFLLRLLRLLPLLLLSLSLLLLRLLLPALSISVGGDCDELDEEAPEELSNVLRRRGRERERPALRELTLAPWRDDLPFLRSRPRTLDFLRRRVPTMASNAAKVTVPMQQRAFRRPSKHFPPAVVVVAAALRMRPAQQKQVQSKKTMLQVGARTGASGVSGRRRFGKDVRLRTR